MEKICAPQIISVPELNGIHRNSPLEEVSWRLDFVDRHAIQFTPWAIFPYKPPVSFSIAYADDCILLKYFVQENSIRLAHDSDNSFVHEDSCVEFFIAFTDDGDYYNLEFNCAGTCSFGFGNNNSRRQIRQEMIDKIRRFSMIQRVVDGESRINWQLTLVFPLEIFEHHSIGRLQGTQCRVNFYKCGDLLPDPHFLAWNNIESTSPNFHLPEFFGTMYFV